ncbi:FapA family protein [bacterium]|nr:FapA family protein [bacterium]
MDKLRLNALETIEFELSLLEEKLDNLSFEELTHKISSLESHLSNIKNSNLDAQAIIELNQDHTSAYLTITSPKIGGKPLLFDEIINSIKDQGIVNPFLKTIKENFLAQNFDLPILIAKGHPPTKGKNAYLSYCLAQNKEIKGVIPGQIVAVKVPPMMGKSGLNVKGEEIPALWDNEISLTLGKNLKWSSDRKFVIATAYGQLFWKKDLVWVERICKVKGNLSKVIGNLNFDGKVIIEGDVDDGLLIEATGDVEVKGEVKKAEIISQENVYVEKEIKDEAKVLAKGNIQAKEVINSTVNTESSIFVSSKIINSHITVRERVILEDKESELVGGNIIANQEIVARTIGSKKKLNTYLESKDSISALLFYPGVKLKINNIEHKITKEIKSSTFYEMEGKVVGKPYQEEIINQEGIIKKNDHRSYLTKEIAKADFPISIIIVSKDTNQALTQAAEYLGIKEEKLASQTEKFLEEGSLSIRVFYKDQEKTGPWKERISSEVILEEPGEGRFELKNKENGLYLSVYSPKGKGKPITSEVVLEEIRKNKFIDLNLDELKRTVKNCLKEIIIAPRQINLEKDGQAILEYPPDKLLVYLTLIPHKKGGLPVTLEYILKLIKNLEIVSPINQEVISRALSRKQYHQKILIAQGKPSTKGNDAEVVFFFGIDYSKSFEDKDHLAIPGELIVKIRPRTIGEKGVNIFGEEIPALWGKKVKITSGRNVLVSEDDLSFYAADFGQVTLNEDQINVDKVYLLPTNVNSRIGSIDFPGRIIIKGKVEKGFEVIAKADIKITGNFEGNKLSCQGDLTIEAGISPSGKAEIKVEGNLQTPFITNAFIQAKGNVVFQNQIKDSQITANIVGSKEERSVISGSEINASEYLQVGFIGESNTETIINIKDPQGKINVYHQILKGVKIKIGEVVKEVTEEISSATLKIKEIKEKIVKEENGIKKEEIITKLEISPDEFKEEEVNKIVLSSEKKIIDLQKLPPSLVIFKESSREATEEGAKLLDMDPQLVKTNPLSSSQKGKVRVSKKDIKNSYLQLTPEEIRERCLFIPDVDGAFELTNIDSGLYLTAHPPIGKGKKISKELILKIIEEKEYQEINDEALERILAEAKEIPEQIGPRQIIDSIDGKVIIEILDKGAKAAMTIIPPKKSGREVNFDHCLKALHKKGVIVGIKESELRNALSNKKFNTPLIVAEEIPPLPGKDAQINYKIKTDSTEVTLIEDENKKIDYKKISVVENVLAGQLIALKEPASLEGGKPGKKVTGEEILIPLGKELKIPAGKNTKLSGDETELYATIDGHIILINDKLNVEPIYELKGDVNIRTGNIEFLGTVIIEGGVEDGFKVETEGDIRIADLVGAATLSAGGNIFIEGGIKGKKRANIFAKGDVKAKFVENAHISACRNIMISNEVLHSHLNAGRSVMVSENKGLIIGGRVRAGEEILANEIGCKVHTKTNIEVGVLPKTREQLQSLDYLIEKDEKILKQVKLNIATLEKMQSNLEGNFTKEKADKLIQLKNLNTLISFRLRSYYERKEILGAQLAISKQGKISITKTIYPGTTVLVRGASLEVKEELTSVVLMFENNKIKVERYLPEKSTAH